MNETKYYTIFSQRLMSNLVAQGFVLISMRPDEKGSGRNVFYFAIVQNFDKPLKNTETNN